MGGLGWRRPGYGTRLLPSVFGMLLVVACGATDTPPSPSTGPTAVDSSTSGTVPAFANSTADEGATAHPVVVAAGDVGRCDSNADEETAALASRLPHTAILLLGDLAYDDGAAEEFADCLDTSWGVHKGRIRPVPGNHEYHTDDAAAYFEYFGEAAGDPEEGWYSFQLGSWHLVGLNSNCGDVGCGTDSPQAAWLRDDLTRNAGMCTLVYTHHPRFSSGEHGSFDDLDPLWELMSRHGVDLLLSAHDHGYERFAAMDAGGRPAVEEGIRQFVVGTGGAPLREFRSPEPNSEFRIAGEHGVLRLGLDQGSYRWEFWSIEGTEPLDRGEAECFIR